MAPSGKPRPRLLPRRRIPPWAPVPPVKLPPASLVLVEDRGEFFVRDSGGDGPPVLLLHGWVVTADLNWFTTYRALIDAGYRVLALDHRGHGRGLRPHADFRLEDCATDAAAVLETLGVDSALAVGYSMGGPIASLMARDHPERVSGVVLCATAPDWQDRTMRVIWSTVGVFRVLSGLFPRGVWRAGVRLAGFSDSPATSWFTAELTRGSSVDIAEAGRELGRYDARPWLGSLRPPAAVVVTSRDRSVPPRKQHELAQLLGARTYDVPGDHAAVTVNAEKFNRELLAALEHVRAEASRDEAPLGAELAPQRVDGLA